MAEENKITENKDEITEHEIKKPLLDAFKDLFKRPAALPGEIPSKHKTTNIDMKTSMSFREFRANIMKSVGDFFQSLSKLGSPKKEETLNKYAKEYVNNTTEKSTEKTKNDDEKNFSQQQIRIPGQVSIKNARTIPSVEHISIDKSAVEDIDKSKLDESNIEIDSSSDEILNDTDIIPEINIDSSKTNTKIVAENLVTENNNDSKSQNNVTKKNGEPDSRDL